MDEVILKLSVVSDLHCHPKRVNYSQDKTHLFSDKLRSPSKNHPIESLYHIIDKFGLESDILLCPGDFTDQSDTQGLISGWQFVQEIARALDCPEVIATLGNHDVDSRNSKSNYSFDVAKRIRQQFPLTDKLIGTFWDKGYTFVELPNTQILVVNSVHYHTHSTTGPENPINKGRIDKGAIEEIEKYLQNNCDDNKIKILLCHHHPAQHSRNDGGEHDFIENGQELLDILGKFKYDLAVHGHKHDPWLRYQPTATGYQIPILASGSFSASGQADYIGKFNYFHQLTITKSNCRCTAKMTTWEYHLQTGWELSNEENFKAYSGFGYIDNETLLADKIESYLDSAGDKIVNWEDIINQVPEVENLTPDKIDLLQSLLLEKNIFTHPNIGSRPKHCYKHG